MRQVVGTHGGEIACSKKQKKKLGKSKKKKGKLSAASGLPDGVRRKLNG